MRTRSAKRPLARPKVLKLVNHFLITDYRHASLLVEFPVVPKWQKFAPVWERNCTRFRAIAAWSARKRRIEAIPGVPATGPVIAFQPTTDRRNRLSTLSLNEHLKVSV